MAPKTLLTESEIRRFMKLASMTPLGNGKLQEIAEDEMQLGVDLAPKGGDDVEGLELEEPELEPEPEGLEVSITDEEADVLVDLGNKIEDVQGPPEEEVEDVDVDMDLEGPMGDEQVDLPAEDEVPGMRKSYQEARSTRRRSLSEDSEAEETAHYSEDEDADKRRYDDMLDHVKSLEEHLHALKGDMDYDEGHIDERAQRKDAIVKEVSRRVAARLAKENQQEEMVDQLAERIMARLVK